MDGYAPAREVCGGNRPAPGKGAQDNQLEGLKSSSVRLSRNRLIKRVTLRRNALAISSVW